MSVTQFVTSSGPPVTMQLDMAIAMAGLSMERAEEIFLLTHKAKKLGRKIACNFINLSSQEVLFHMGAQATGYKQVASGCPDRVTAYYAIMHSKVEKVENLNEAVDHLCQQAGEAWLDMNSTLFHHTLKYDTKLNNFLTESENAIEALHDCILTVMIKVMEDTGAPVSDGLGITVCLVDMLPTILIHLAFHSTMPMLTSFVPGVYASWPWLRMNIMDVMHTPPLQSDWKTLDVLHEEIINNLGGAPKAANVVQPTACFSVPSLSSVGGQAGEFSTGDGTTKSPHTSHTPCSPSWCSQTQSLSPWHHSQIS